MINLSKAWRLIFLLGLVSLFADVTYEGARSIIPNYLTIVLGASVLILGTVTGLGEFLNYGLRLVTGPLSDLTKRYWLFTFMGYVVNLFAVPLLALTGNWQSAAALIIVERMGKAIRAPARDVIISNISKGIGRGKAFGVHEVLDQVGAILGPSIAILALYFTKENYRYAFSVFALPALIALSFLTVAYLFFKRHREELVAERPSKEGRLGFKFWSYTLVITLSTMGLMYIPFLIYRAGESRAMPEWIIPSLLLIAQAVDALIAPFAGLAYDRVGLKSIFVIFPFTLAIPIFAYTPQASTLILAATSLGVVMGVQETIERAAVADLSPVRARGRAYGIFNAFLGLSLLLGGVVIGYLYSVSFTLIIVYAIATQALAFIIALFTLR